MKPPVLYIFAGLPGSGKTTLSQNLATHLGAAHLRVDTIEQAVRDLCHINVLRHVWNQHLAFSDI